ncbi:MAG: class I SAM-dependent methyltransferase [Cyclobacteriaceae bacterium]
MKDLFSGHAEDYARYRPGYPDELFDFIFTKCKGYRRAWDCGTGNGQAAIRIAGRFTQTEATDISNPQLESALAAEGLNYTVCSAEQTPFDDGCFDLVTVAQALHWFDFDRFFPEVARVCRPDGLYACWGYELLNVDEDTDAIIRDFYKRLDPYWQPERKYIENSYSTIPFPWKMQKQSFTQTESWTREGLCRYIETWSAVKKARQEGGPSVDELRKELGLVWPDDEVRMVRFPIFLWYGYPNG